MADVEEGQCELRTNLVKEWALPILVPLHCQRNGNLTTQMCSEKLVEP